MEETTQLTVRSFSDNIWALKMAGYQAGLNSKVPSGPDKNFTTEPETSHLGHPHKQRSLVSLLRILSYHGGC